MKISPGKSGFAVFAGTTGCGTKNGFTGCGRISTGTSGFRVVNDGKLVSSTCSGFLVGGSGLSTGSGSILETTGGSVKVSTLSTLSCSPDSES